MDIAIYGINDITKDFLYLFETVQVGAFFIDTEERPDFDMKSFGREARKIDEILSWYEENKSLVVICGLDYLKKAEMLEFFGLVHNKDYIYAHEIGNKFVDAILSAKEINWFGSIKYFHKIKTIIPGIKVAFYHSERELHKEVFSDDKLWIIASGTYSEIAKTLIKKGLKENENFISVQQLLDWDIENILKKVFYSKRQYNDFKCAVPFRMISVSKSRLHICCGGRLSLSISSLRQNFLSAWYSIRRKIICLSVLNGTYAFCNQRYCPLLSDWKHSEKKLNYIHYAKADADLDYKSLPVILQLEYDGACNLSCSSCRKQYITNEIYPEDTTTEYILSEIMPLIKEIRCAGFGEALYSKNYLTILKDSRTDNKDLYLLSNGLLLDEHKLIELINKFLKVSIDISVDAGTSDTYSDTRGGSFKKLVENLRKISKARAKEQIVEFVLNFTISQINIADIDEFVKLGKALHADYIKFSAVHNWGIWNDEEFESISILDEDYKIKKELKKYFLNPELQSDFVLDNNVGFKNEC